MLAVGLLLTLAAQGEIVADIRCAADASQGYALYVPKAYRADKAWPLLLLFDPRARGVTGVERFAEAAEKFGWIVAGSNNSRNGSWDVSMASLTAMSRDLMARYSIDEKRMYTGGMSGGARVAMQVALGTGRIAGVIAGSAGYPDSEPRKSVPFKVFSVAGTEDFNWLEMQELDRALKTPHRLRIFEGGHVWMPKEVAIEAIEWMEAPYVEMKRDSKIDKREKQEMQLEWMLRKELVRLEGQGASGMEGIEELIKRLGRMTKKEAGSVDHRVAMRIGRGLASTTMDAKVRKMLEEVGFGSRVGPPR